MRVGPLVALTHDASSGGAFARRADLVDADAIPRLFERPDMVAAIESDTALGRFGEAAEIAAVVAFLAFEEGRWTTAPAIEASGG